MAKKEDKETDFSGSSSTKLQKKMAKRAKSSVKPIKVDKSSDDTGKVKVIPFPLKFLAGYAALSTYKTNKKYEKIITQANKCQQEARHAVGMFETKMVEMKQADIEHQKAKLEKKVQRRQKWAGLIGQITGSASMMARTQMMGVGTGVIRANDKGISKNIVSTMAWGEAGQIAANAVSGSQPQMG